jgi:hypothetical protein
VEAEMSGSFVSVRDGAVDVDLGVKHRDGWGTSITRVIKLVATGGHAYTMGLCLLRADVADKISVGDFLRSWGTSDLLIRKIVPVPRIFSVSDHV